MISILLQHIENAVLRKDISKLQKLVSYIIDIVPIAKVDLTKGTELQRIRNNYKGEIFFSENDISYRKDTWNISEFGRCNFPNSSKFYCSVSSDYIKEIRVVNVLETNKFFRDNFSIHKKQIFTSGQWICKEPLTVGIFPFNRNAKNINSEIKSHSLEYDHILKSFSKKDRENAKIVLPFISNYLAKKHIFSHWDYMISAYFSELILEKYNLDGILYPSVRADYRTYNLAIQPDSTNKLFFQMAAMFELIVDGKNAYIDNLADGEIGQNGKIFWTQLERSSEAEIKRFLK